MTDTGRVAATGLVVVLVLAGLVLIVSPAQLLSRTSFLSNPGVALAPLAHGFAAMLMALAVGLFAATRDGRIPPWARFAAFALAALPIVVFAQIVSDWWIDDAGITFAYSRSLAEGYGLVGQPGMPPEEGYSSPLWMSVLAAGHVLGLDIHDTAKNLGLACAVATAILGAVVVMRSTDDLLSSVVAAALCATAPVVVWAASGQEHALQSLLLMAAVYAAGLARRARLWLALVLAIYVLVRPEAPLVVICAGIAVWLTSERQTPAARLWDGVVVGLPAFGVACALLAFRILYFGDPFSNPYYAKPSSSLDTLVNPFGGGWQYVLVGLSATGSLFVAGLVAGLTRRPQGRVEAVALGLLGGHLLFVIWAGGDWMAQWRFLMPILPLLAVLLGMRLNGIASVGTRILASLLIVVGMTSFTIRNMADVHAGALSTPLAVVVEVGDRFARLARSLGVEDPLLAHHDAGGIAYSRNIRLLDLGGLLDRNVAKNMTDRSFLTQYVVHERRPAFVFGAYNFAARSGFTETADFAAAYVPLAFPGQEIMAADVSYIRRDLVRDVPGVAVLRGADGRAERVDVAADPQG